MLANWQIHHIGIAVWDIVAARDVYAQLGFECSEILQYTSLNVRLVFCRRGDTATELIAPIDENSPCMYYLRRIGPGAYHVCYNCNSIEKSLKQLDEKKIEYKIIAKPQMPAGLAPVIFLLIPACGLIELTEGNIEES